MKDIIFAVAISLMLHVVQAGAQPGFWEKTGGWSGGLSVHALGVTSYPIVFAGTEAGIFRSDGSETHWIKRNQGLTVKDVRAIATDLIASGYIFIGTNGGGIYRSTNNGDIWVQCNNGLIPPDVYSLRILSDSSVFAGTSEGIFKSTDMGIHWQWLANGPSGSVIALDRDDSDYVYAGTATDGFFMSWDHGQTWNQRNAGLPNLNVRAVAWGGGVRQLFVGGPAGVFASASYGVTWLPLSGGLTDINVTALAVRSGIGPLVAGTETGGIFLMWPYYSSVWVPYNDLRTVRRVTSLAGYFAGTQDSGVFRSFGPGNPEGWADLRNGLTPALHDVEANNAQTLFVATDYSGTFRSTNRGDTWTEINAGIPEARRGPLAVGRAGLVFAGTDGKSYRSSDEGDTWHAMTASLANLCVRPDGVLFGVTNSSVLVSGDDGGTWNTTNWWGGVINSIAHDNAGSMLVGRGYQQGYSDKGVWSTEDGGTRWVLLGQGALGISSLAAPRHGLIFAHTYWTAGSLGSFRTSDNGATWSQMPFDFNQMVSTRSGEIFATAGGVGVERSTDDGATWSSVNSGLRSSDAGYIAVDSSGFLYVTCGDALFRSVSSTTSAENSDHRAPSKYALFQNYPNPFNPSTAIRYTLPNRTHVMLAVFNTLGQKVATLVNSNQDAGEHEVRLDGSALSSGPYFYRLQAGGYVETRKSLLVR